MDDQISNPYARIAFTGTVKAVQQDMGSRRGAARLEAMRLGNDRLGSAEATFMESLDGFYVATTSETGWPYVQYRGGPAGFLRVLDEHTIGWADFRGNRQYISVGNVAADSRVALMLMDYATQTRLKVYGRARIVDTKARPDLMAELRHDDYPAIVERAVLVDVAAFDWNCPNHITPRFTEEQVARAIEPLQAELERLRVENELLRSTRAE